MSIAQLNVNNFELTPMRVSFKAPGGASFVDLGGTHGNVKVKIEYKKAPIKADQAGTEPIDHKVSGLMVQVSTILAEIQDKSRWAVAFPHATTVHHTVLAATITAASPAVVSATAHGFNVGDRIQFTAGTVPTGVALNTDYFIISSGFTANSFEFSATAGGSAINGSGSPGSGVTIVGFSDDQIAIDMFTNIGNGGQVNAGQLLLHPLSKDDTDKSTDYLFYKACSMAATEVTYGPENQVGLQIDWFIYPDMGNSQKYMRYGDKDLT